MSMLRRFLLVTALLLAIVMVGACVTEYDAPTLFVGMSRDRLRARFGEPLRVEHTSAGGEDWYYSFSGPPEVQADSYHDEQSNSGSVSVTISSSTSRQECPVHLSPEGYVIEPLPRGHIVR